MNQDAYRKLISGKSSKPGAVLLRFILGIAALVYRVIVGLRNFLYSKGWLKIHRADVPVISIGNITTGGTGKTPLVIRLCNFLRSSGTKCAILTRGYKANQNYGDEPAVLAESCPGVQVVINPDRIAGAKAASKSGAQVLIMDDGFQHRRLARDLDIVTIDGTVPFGYGRLLPAGLLREPVNSLKRADAVVITRCDQIEEKELVQLEDELKQINPDMVIARSVHAPVYAKSTDDRETSLEELEGKRIFAFCGIGNPEASLSTVKGLGAKLVGSRIFDDHYHYTDDCIADIYDRAQHLDADLILTTQKDWISISSLAITHSSEDINVAFLAIELRFTNGEEKITQLIKNALAGRI